MKMKQKRQQKKNRKNIENLANRALFLFLMDLMLRFITEVGT